VGEHPVTDGDAVYYAFAGRNRWAQALSRRTRVQVYGRFTELLRPGPETTILDVGVSVETSRSEANVLEKLYPHRDQITCAGIGPDRTVSAEYPGVRFVPIRRNEPLPFPDASFDIAYSHAVVEHVGTTGDQARFVRELCRVGRRVFVVTPNRWFPIEHHTGIPLLHVFSMALFRRRLRGTRYDYWTREENLNPLTFSTLKRLFPSDRAPRVERVGTGLGPFQSNLLACA
jgi:SAM-dependent methyltransferase